MNPVGVYVPISAVFPSIRSEFPVFKSLLEGLSLTDTLFWCARLNLILANPTNLNHKAKQQYGLDIFMDASEIERINEFMRQERSDIQHVSVFFRGQLLELLRWASLLCQDLPNDGSTFEEPEMRRTFAKATLLASDIWNQRIYGDRFSLEGGRDVARRRSLGAIRKATEENSSGFNPLMALGRGKALFMDHLPKFHPQFGQEFQSKTSISLEEYYLCICAFMTNYLNLMPEKARQNVGHSGIFNVDTFCNPAPHMKPVFSRYLSLESQTTDELRHALWGDRNSAIPDDAPRYDFKPLRERPILRTNDDRAIILDPVFYAERGSIGPLFLASRGASRKESNKIFSAFGYAFESYARELLQSMFPSVGSLLPSRLKPNLKGKSINGQEIEIADALIDYGDRAVLIEMKAVWVREEVILENDYEKYLDHLRQRYGVIETDGERPKGVAQLARAISNISTGKWHPLGQEFEGVRVIYPVLLVHDTLLNAPVHPDFLASEFEVLLRPDDSDVGGNKKKGKFHVAPLILMTLEDLENLETSVEGFSLLDLLRDYSMDCADRLVSLHNFIATSPIYKDKIRHSRSVAEKTLELLKSTMVGVFRTYPSGKKKAH